MKKSFIALAFAMLALSGCSQYSLVNSETYNDADLSAIHSFRIVTPDNGKLPDGMQMVTYYNIAAAIREQLVERGWTEDPSSPIMVNIAVTVRRDIETAPALPPGAPYGLRPWRRRFGPAFIYPRSYYSDAKIITGISKEGVLTMDIVDIAKKLPLYSASVATIIEDDHGHYRDLRSIAEAVDVLFKEFPVPPLPAASE